MPRPRKVTDEQIIAAAARAVGRCGPQALNLAHVAVEAGVAPATLIQRFGSKRALLLAVAESGAGTAAAAFDAARARHRSPSRALIAALADLASRVTDPDEVAHHLAFLALDLADEEFRALAARHFAAVRSEIDALVGEAEAAGELAIPRGGRAAMVEAVLSIQQGTMLVWAVDRRGTAAAAVTARLRLLLARG